MPLPGGGFLCPASDWLDRVAPLLSRDAGPSGLTLLNAGANKGFTTALLLQRFGGANFTNAHWLAALRMYAGKSPITTHVCGVCCACVEPPPPLAAVRDSLPVNVYAFEPLRKNFGFLKHAFERFSTPRAFASVQHAALGNQRNTTVAIPDAGIVMGKENVGPKLMGDGGRPAGSISVPVIVLDDWLKERSIDRVDLALFDAEGWDNLILDGLKDSLAAQRVVVFEFEASYHSRWEAAGTRTLNQTLAWLGSMEYDCFFEYDNGCLAPAGPPCQPPWPALSRTIQNVVCAAAGAQKSGRVGSTSDAVAELWQIANACTSSDERIRAPVNRSWTPSRSCYSSK